MTSMSLLRLKSFTNPLNMIKISNTVTVYAILLFYCGRQLQQKADLDNVLFFIYIKCLILLIWGHNRLVKP